MLRLLLALTLVLLLTPRPAAADATGLTAEQRLGKSIYTDGTGVPGTRITATLGRGGPVLPAAVLPCAGCHGRDGRGRPEGGVSPSNIVWSSLTKAYGQRHASGRAHPPYDPRTVIDAIVRGIDPAGNPLDPAMPRYAMSDREARALVAYLQRLEGEAQPGLSEETITVGLVYPPDPALQPMLRSMAATIDALFADLNAEGGIYRRTLRLRPTTAAGGDDDGVFASIGTPGPWLGEADGDRLPLLVPIGLAPAREGDAPLPGATAFYVLPPLERQLAALLQAAATGGGRLALVVGQGWEGAAERLQVEAIAPGARVVSLGAPADAAAMVARLRRDETTAVLLAAGAADVRAVADAAAAASWFPPLWLLAQLAGPALSTLPGGFADRVFVGYPTLPKAGTSRGHAALDALLRDHRVAVTHPVAQASAYAAATVLVEVLRRVGRSLTRDAFLDALQGVTAFETGVTPPVSFSAGRRVGPAGMYLLTFDVDAGRFKPEERWLAFAP